MLLFAGESVVKSQDSTLTVITMQQAVDSTLKNNPRLQNALLRIEQAKLDKIRAWDFTPTEFKYQYGQINSPLKDQYFEINQNFGSVLEHIQRLKEAKANETVETTAYILEVKKLTAEAKSAYTFWQYTYMRSSLLKEEMDNYQRLADIADMRYKLGDTDLLNRTMAVSKVSEVTSRYLNTLDELVIAENKLKQLMMINARIIPDGIEPQLYMIDKSSDTAQYTGNIYIQYYSDRYKWIMAQESAARSMYFPEFQLGYFHQKIDNISNLQGWQIGMAFPLWIPKQQAVIRQNKIDTEIAYSELEYQKHLISSSIENLLYELNKYFRQIQHFTENALPQAEILLRTTSLQLEAEEIDYTQYLQSISLAIQIKSDYYLAINNYNQIAIQLEIYGN